MRAVTGGLYWTDDASSGEGGLFVELAGTLGVPDYAVRTAADLDPSLIFQKYLGDAARSVCWQLVERERSDPASRVLMKRVVPTDTWEAAPDKIDDNLKWLLLRFHGHATGDDTTALELWRWLFRSAALVSQDPVVAWRTVCVGLITHPDFYLY
jgi:cytolysin (calcineurin-like family phosphatase)